MTIFSTTDQYKTVLLQDKKHTIFFNCGAALKAWKLTESVWEEHGRWSPDCIYVKHMKKDPTSVLNYAPREE